MSASLDGVVPIEVDDPGAGMGAAPGDLHLPQCGGSSGPGATADEDVVAGRHHEPHRFEIVRPDPDGQLDRQAVARGCPGRPDKGVEAVGVDHLGQHRHRRRAGRSAAGGGDVAERLGIVDDVTLEP